MAKKGGKIALALGLLTGAATGILFAPGKGKDLRKRISNERKSGGTGAKAVGNDLKKMSEEIVDLMKEVAETEEVKGFMHKLKGETAKITNMKKEDLDAWVKKAHDKAEKMKELATKYAKHKKAEMEGRVKKKVKKATVNAKKTVKKAATKVKKTATKISKTADKVAKKVDSKKKKK